MQAIVNTIETIINANDYSIAVDHCGKVDTCKIHFAKYVDPKGLCWLLNDTHPEYIFTLDGSVITVQTVAEYSNSLPLITADCDCVEYSVTYVNGMWAVDTWNNDKVTSSVSFSTRSKADKYAQCQSEASRYTLVNWDDTIESEMDETVDTVQWIASHSCINNLVIDPIPNGAVISLIGYYRYNTVTEFIETLNANGYHCHCEDIATIRIQLAA